MIADEAHRNQYDLADGFARVLQAVSLCQVAQDGTNVRFPDNGQAEATLYGTPW